MRSTRSIALAIALAATPVAAVTAPEVCFEDLPAGSARCPSDKNGRLLVDAHSSIATGSTSLEVKGGEQ